MTLYAKPKGVQTRWSSFENPAAAQGAAALENAGAKGHAFDRLHAGETKPLLEIEASGLITRIWMTISDRSPEMLRSLKLEMFWEGEEKPAVSTPLGDFFGVGLGRRTPFKNALFSDPEGRSFNCTIPMPFRKQARITLTNDSDRDLIHLFYDVDLLTGIEHETDTLYFHTNWRRESPNSLGDDYILLKTEGSGRFLGCNVGVIANPAYQGSWWGEGEFKARFGGEEHPTLCGTGLEDYIGTGWGQGAYSHRTQGCLVADAKLGQWAFYRFHIEDPIYFDSGAVFSFQTIGGSGKSQVIEMQNRGVPLHPVSIDPGGMSIFIKLNEQENPVDLQSPETADGWVNFWRQDDWSSTAYYYSDSPEGSQPPLAPVAERTLGLNVAEETSQLADT